jgi:hypothetical protein
MPYIITMCTILSFVLLVGILSVSDMLSEGGMGVALAIWIVLAIALIPTSITMLKYCKKIFPEYFISWEEDSIDPYEIDVEKGIIEETDD